MRADILVTLQHQYLAEIHHNTSTTNTLILKAFQSPEGRIINGTLAKQGQFPFQVYINADNILCGGSIINNNTVLTAAHCVYKQNNQLVSASKTKIYAGGLKKSAMQRFKVRKVIPHENYDGEKFYNDIAILKIKNTFWDGSPTQNIAPISVTSLRFPSNTECTASGWGRTSANGQVSTELMYTNLHIYSHNSCDEFYQKWTGSGITDSMICTNDPMSTVCSGDSGGPLVVNNQETGNITQLVGIVSFGILGCPTSAPSVYTDAYQYKDWIEKNSNSYGISYHASSWHVLYSVLFSSLILYFKP
ncbi:chymotrypsin-2-like isoform X2 [Chrysoperla carnea]|uniref:chymotrypsin-2-like isoform X2 n=1 Tax=Chrysoperla carnea TaxID=189513 RepID=UPI001D091A14|nr:chymotrypsin-2-like isoform X2 [Chrysoperla carnea]